MDTLKDVNTAFGAVESSFNVAKMVAQGVMAVKDTGQNGQAGQKQKDPTAQNETRQNKTNKFVSQCCTINEAAAFEAAMDATAQQGSISSPAKGVYHITGNQMDVLIYLQTLMENYGVIPDEINELSSRQINKKKIKQNKGQKKKKKKQNKHIPIHPQPKRQNYRKNEKQFEHSEMEQKQDTRYQILRESQSILEPAEKYDEQILVEPFKLQNSVLQMNITVIGKKTKAASKKCFNLTIILACLLFPILFCFCNCWKKKINPTYEISEHFYTLVAKFIKKSKKCRKLTFTIVDNEFNQAKAKRLSEGVANSSLRGFLLINEAKGCGQEVGSAEAVQFAKAAKTITQAIQNKIKPEKAINKSGQAKTGQENGGNEDTMMLLYFAWGENIL